MSVSVLQGIVARSQSAPDHSAVKDLQRELSYAELIDEVARLGAGLIGRGIAEGDRVALLIPNSVDFVVAALATLWVGAVFVPLAPSDPPTRVEAIAVDCRPSLILAPSTAELQSPHLLGGVELVSIDALRMERGVSAREGDDRSRVAYMIYTSGTTGAPKGVQIGNAAFAAAVRSVSAAIGVDEATRTLCVSPFHFDGAYANLFPTLVWGGTVVIRPRDSLLYPRTFFKAVRSEAITYAGFTPSYLRLLLASPQASEFADSTLAIIALGGEAVPVAQLRSLWSRAPSVRVFNRYGPTETTISVTDVELTPSMIESGSVTIGRPHPGVSFVVVDEQDHVIDEADRIGELYIGGVQLMDGYWANPELTSQVLRSDIVPGETLYRTGDLVYRSEEGEYYYVDRADRVVKRSGVRISLVELSASMGMVDGVDEAACVLFDHDGELGIAAFVVADRDLSVLDIRRATGRLIPETMLPDRIEIVPAMPIGRSNQLDEDRLLSGAGLEKYQRISLAPGVPE